MGADDLINDFKKYRDIRLTLLRKLDRPDSNRDPLAEFSEKLAEIILGARRTKRREQKGYDLESPVGEKIEAKYVAQLTKKDGTIDWKNWHTVRFNEYRDKYALVVFASLLPKAMFVFSRNKLRSVCQELGKKHPDKESTLQFTKTDYIKITTNPETFKKLGVDLFLLD